MIYTLEQLNAKIESNNGNLNLRNSSIESLPEGLNVGGNLDLGFTKIKSLPEGLIVGGNLEIYATRIKSLPKGLCVGGSLYIGHNEIKSLPEGLKVGGELWHEYFRLSDDQRLREGDYVPNEYIYCDGILTFIKNAHQIGKYTYYRGHFSDKNVIYDGTYYTHCKDLKSGIAGLDFKHAKGRGADQYKDLTINSVVSKDQAINMYRVITGACQSSTENFINNLKEVKESYTIQEIIDLTRGQYGSRLFEEFFTR